MGFAHNNIYYQLGSSIASHSHKGKRSENPKERQTLNAAKQSVYCFSLSSRQGTEWIQPPLCCDRWKYNALVKATSSITHHWLFLAVESQQITLSTVFPCTPCCMKCVAAAPFSHLDWTLWEQGSTAWLTARGSCSAVHLHSQWELRSLCSSLWNIKRQVSFGQTQILNIEIQQRERYNTF